MNSHGYSYGYSGPCSWAIHAPGTDSSSPSNIWGPTSHVLKVLYDFGIGWGRRGARRKCVTILAAHIWPTFSRHGPKCVTKIPGPPQQSADQKVLRIQNVLRMCHECVTNVSQKSLAQKYVLGIQKFAFGAGGFSQRASPAKGQR